MKWRGIYIRMWWRCFEIAACAYNSFLCGVHIFVVTICLCCDKVFTHKRIHLDASINRVLKCDKSSKAASILNAGGNVKSEKWFVVYLNSLLFKTVLLQFWLCFERVWWKSYSPKRWGCAENLFTLKLIITWNVVIWLLSVLSPKLI